MTQNSFNPIQTNPEVWKNCWLVPGDIPDSIVIKPKPSYFLGYEIKTHETLQHIRTIFIKTLQTSPSGDSKFLVSNVEQFNAQLEKYNKNQFWDSFKVDLIKINYSNISNGNFIELIKVLDVINIIGDFLELKHFIRFKISCKNLAYRDFPELISKMRMQRLLSHCYSGCNSLSKPYLEEFFVLLIQEYKYCDIDTLVSPLKSPSSTSFLQRYAAANDQLISFLRWTDNKTFDDGFHDFIGSFLSLSAQIQIKIELTFSNRWTIAVSSEEMITYLKVILLYPTDPEGALKGIDQVPDKAKIFLILSLADKTKIPEKKDSLIKTAEEILAKNNSVSCISRSYYDHWRSNNLISSSASSLSSYEERLHTHLKADDFQKLFDVAKNGDIKEWRSFIDKCSIKAKAEASKIIFFSKDSRAIEYITPQMFSAVWSQDKQLTLKWCYQTIRQIETKSDNYKKIAILLLSHSLEL